MTDAEILEKLRAYFQNQINNLNATEMAEGPFEDGTEFGDAWEAAAKAIDRRGGLRIRFEFADSDLADRMVNLVAFLEKGAQMLVDRIGQVDEVLARLRDEHAVQLPLAEVAEQRQARAEAEARPHDDEPVRPLNSDCSRGAFLRLECDLQLDGASVLSLHKVGPDVHLRVWHAGSEQYAVAVLDRAYRRDVVHALTEFDTSEADRG